MSIPADPYGELRQRPESQRKTRTNVRCANCGKLLAEMLTAPWSIRCSRCKADNHSAEDASQSL
jgi:phage FluMu protein Com